MMQRNPDHLTICQDAEQLRGSVTGCIAASSLHPLLSLQITSILTFLSRFVTFLSFVQCLHSDSSFWTPELPLHLTFMGPK